MSAEAGTLDDSTLTERLATALFHAHWWELAGDGALSTGVLARALADRLAGTLDEAWAAAEAALPEGADFAVSKTVGVQSGPYVAVSADAGVHAYADTPAAALLALAAALRAVPA